MTPKHIIAIFLLWSICSADSNVTVEENPNYIDDIHATLSNKVLEWSDKIDITLSSWVGNDETNNTTVKPNISTKNLEAKVQSIDSFFQNNKYLNETEDAFIRLRTNSYFQSKKSNDFKLKFSIQLPLSKSKKSFKIFMDDLSSDNVKNILQADLEDAPLAPEIGMHYFAPPINAIETKYSLGLRGVHPFVRARYNLPFKFKAWLIDPVQSFRYSTNDEFEEETNIYFDKELSRSSLFRLQLHRKTQTEIDGMDYGISLQYYWIPKKDTGLRLSQSFLGNTKYQYIVDKNVESQTKNYSGINNYLTSFSWRENVWRKWFYYEVRPGVNFEKQYDYEPNYTVRLFLDFYFGQYH